MRISECTNSDSDRIAVRSEGGVECRRLNGNIDLDDEVGAPEGDGTRDEGAWQGSSVHGGGLVL